MNQILRVSAWLNKCTRRIWWDGVVPAQIILEKIVEADFVEDRFHTTATTA
jgi:hypothetical protein